jgi:hypothetical protein
MHRFCYEDTRRDTILWLERLISGLMEFDAFEAALDSGLLMKTEFTIS